LVIFGNFYVKQKGAYKRHVHGQCHNGVFLEHTISENKVLKMFANLNI